MSVGATVSRFIHLSAEARVNRDRNFRQPRRREYVDSDMPRDFGFRRPSTPRFEDAPTPVGPPVSATVKWYNPDKGFGFAELASGGDAFLHASVVERSGNSTVPSGATLEVRTAPGQKGMQITEILSIDTSTAGQEPSRRPRPERPPRTYDQAATEETGTVKWYNATKGFGFIVRDGGGKDIFVHVSAVNQGGLNDLSEGQRVAVDVVEGP